MPRADGFRLIDLATFDPWAPLSRDIATLAISLIARWAGQLDSAEQDRLLRYVVSDAPTSTAPPRFERTWLTDTVRALFNPGRTFITDGWLDVWSNQVRVSCLAQALLHATYGSVGQRGRWWCFRLAARLAGKLLPGHAAGDVRPRRLSPELFAEEPEAVSLVPAAPSAPPSAAWMRARDAGP